MIIMTETAENRAYLLERELGRHISGVLRGGIEEARARGGNQLDSNSLCFSLGHSL
jgi:hypothetical protein